MRIRDVTVFVLVALMFAEPAFADILVLRNGDKHEGVIANREEVRSQAQALEWVGILLDDSSELVRVPVDNIDYIVFEDGETRQVIDFSTMRSSPGAGPKTEPVVGENTRVAALGLMVAGGAAAVIGAVVKFGGEKATITNNEVSYDEHSYNAANFAMIAAGVIIFIAGVTTYGSGTQESEHASAPILEFQSSERSTYIRIGYAVRF